MTSPLPLPDWVPWWVHLALLLAAALFGLLFVLMPFSVLGLKSRLEGIEARLDEIQGEIRSLSLRLPEVIEDDPYQGHYQVDERGYARPPMPPAPYDPGARRPEPRIVRPAGRTEPRLY